MSKKAKVSVAHNIYYVNERIGSVNSGCLGSKRHEVHVFERFSVKNELEKVRNATL